MRKNWKDFDKLVILSENILQKMNSDADHRRSGVIPKKYVFYKADVKTGKPSIYRIKGIKSQDAEITMNVASTFKRVSRLARSYRKPSSFSINILTQNFTDDHLTFIFKHLKKLVYLKNLNIHAPNLPFVTSNGYKFLGKMTTLKYLQKIDFNTSNCEHMTNGFLGFFTKLMFKATSLQTIKLDIHQEIFLFITSLY